MFLERKEYRKNFNSSGQLYISGEILDFTSYDVSVKGILVDIVPGILLAEMCDFETLLKENNSAEIFVKDLMLTGEADIAWAKLDNGKILLGLEFRDVMYNAEKLWRKRRYYRRKKRFSGTLLVGAKPVAFQAINTSVDGMAIELSQLDSTLKPGNVIRLLIDGQESSAHGKIVWINASSEEYSVLGLRYLAIE